MAKEEKTEVTSELHPNPVVALAQIAGMVLLAVLGIAVSCVMVLAMILVCVLMIPIAMPIVLVLWAISASDEKLTRETETMIRNKESLSDKYSQSQKPSDDVLRN